MANPTPNSFVSAYKHYRIQLMPGTEKAWTVENRLTKDVIGRILLLAEEWQFRPVSIEIFFTHTQLLDIAHGLKAVEKRTDNPKLYL